MDTNRVALEHVVGKTKASSSGASVWMQRCGSCLSEGSINQNQVVSQLALFLKVKGHKATFIDIYKKSSQLIKLLQSIELSFEKLDIRGCLWLVLMLVVNTVIISIVMSIRMSVGTISICQMIQRWLLQ